MSDSEFDALAALRHASEQARETLDVEREKLGDVSRVLREESTTVTAKDNSVSVTTDGGGELSNLTFNGTKYRSMPPVQLANTILETIQRARQESQRKLSAAMPDGAIPDVDTQSLASGSVSPQELLTQLVEPMLSDLDDMVTGSSSKPREGGNERHG